jgi:hypothetical protein
MPDPDPPATQHGIRPRNQSLDELELGGGDVQSINISSQAGVALFLAGRSKWRVRKCSASTSRIVTYRMSVLILTVSMSYTRSAGVSYYFLEIVEYSGGLRTRKKLSVSFR